METDMNKILGYIFHTPENTNPAILKQMLKEYKDGGGDVPPEAIKEAVEEYFKEHPIESFVIDPTLSQPDQAAEALATGTALNNKADKATTLEGYGITDGISTTDLFILECSLNLN